MKRFVTLDSLASGEDTKLSEMYFGPQGLIFARTLEGELAMVLVRAEQGRPTQQIRTFVVRKHRIGELRRTFLAALDSFEAGQ